MSPGPSTHSSSALKGAGFFSGASSSNVRSLLRADLASGGAPGPAAEKRRTNRNAAPAADGHGVARLLIVECGVRIEIYAFLQRIGFGQKMIERLHQQRPLGFRQALEIAFPERAVIELPVAAAALDQTRFDVVAAGQLPHLGGRQQAGKTRYRVADQQRAFVPDFAQEAGGAQAAKQGGRHGRNYNGAIGCPPVSMLRNIRGGAAC